MRSQHKVLLTFGIAGLVLGVIGFNLLKIDTAGQLMGLFIHVLGVSLFSFAFRHWKEDWSND